MNVALAVVVLEITDDFTFLLPIMVAIGTAKIVGDQLTPPLFDMIIEVKHIPYLEDESTLAMHKLRCYHIMNKKVKKLETSTNVAEVLHLLQTTRHNGFPVVSTKDKQLKGVLLRTHLEVILRERLFEGDAEEELEKAMKYKPSEWKALLDLEENAQAVFDWEKEFSQDELLEEVDLTNFMNRSPMSVLDEAPVA